MVINVFFYFCISVTDAMQINLIIINEPCLRSTSTVGDTCIGNNGKPALFWKRFRFAFWLSLFVSPSSSPWGEWRKRRRVAIQQKREKDLTIVLTTTVLIFFALHLLRLVGQNFPPDNPITGWPLDCMRRSGCLLNLGRQISFSLHLFHHFLIFDRSSWSYNAPSQTNNTLFHSANASFFF